MSVDHYRNVSSSSVHRSEEDQHHRNDERYRNYSKKSSVEQPHKYDDDRYHHSTEEDDKYEDSSRYHHHHEKQQHLDQDQHSDDGTKDTQQHEKSKKSNKINVWGNASTMNITPYVYKKILTSPYFKSLYEYKTYHEVLELIKNVKYIHPFTDADSNGSPSVAFCLLFKLHTLKLSYKQLKGMLQKDEPTVIKALALLYVRFAVNPDEMWEYFKEYINDESNTVNIFTKKLTLGEFVRSLISNQKLFGSQCILPMLPAKALSRMEDFCQDYQHRNQNKRKQHENPFYNRQSDYRKKQKQDTTPYQQQSSLSGQSSQQQADDEKIDDEPAESRFSKPNFTKASIPSNYTKKYALTKSSDEDDKKFFKHKDITEVETIRLSKK
ncbi:hypothetical protein FDP41_002704 [Naegleria fowleri]|uniref:Pre-mRNA-splicing factor 38 n=1 Tax=Naegleria fowleri TaxID=5763 RepID=A0A6A5BZ08_NAEFO|nr:uncharacterized protein FDP41_002704 [Naegleria fowleri]KAF0978189.1 hypothetical protein FDP41_002704 [Naegleria fowleri]